MVAANQQMERFKACEKEMKTKAFSKEGLIAAARLDPEEQAKVDMSQWLSSMVDELSRQNESTEAEIEQAVATSRRSRKGGAKEDRVSLLEHQNERRSWHISRLEILHRLLENGSLEVERINDVKDDIAYFVESNAEEDFDEDEGIYDEFNLDEEEEAFGLRDNEGSTSPDASPNETQEEKPVPVEQEEAAPKPVEEPKKPVEEPKKPKKTAETKETPKDRVVLATNFDQGKVQQPAPVPQPKTTSTAPLPPIRYAAAAAAAVSSPSATHATPAASTEHGDKSEADVSTDSAAHVPAQAPQPAQAPTVRPEARLPGTLADLVSSFESAKQKSLLSESNLGQMQHTLDTSFADGVPEPTDSESPKYYVPKDPFPTPHYYPQTPAAIFDNPALYSNFDVDTLFYIFYYQQGTYHQYLAARELKKQSWRFHKQYLTWFQRHSEPQAITDEYEQGAYVYFDWEGSWCQRKKSDFRFEYRWLEDN